MSTNQNNRRRLALETLENKRLLAGDVMVNVDDGNLLIRGDEASNGIAISSGDMAGEFVIVGLPVGDAATSINGIFSEVVVTGVSRSILMGLGHGDDVANLFRANVRGSVSVAAGAGNDHVNVGGPQTSLTDVNTVIHGHLRVNMGDGNDSLRISGSGIGHGLKAGGGLGNDYVAVANSRIGGASAIYTGADNDEVTVGGTHADSMRIRTGTGADQVALVDSVFSSVAANMGDGRDQLALTDVRAGAAYLQGGRGLDALQLSGQNLFGYLRISGFEFIQGASDAAVDASHADTTAYDVDELSAGLPMLV